MPRRRFRFSLRLLFTSVLDIAVVLGILVASRDPVINRSNYNNIRLGMTESVVDELLDGISVEWAPLTYEDVTFEESREALLHEHSPPHMLRSWKSGSYLISVIFDKDGRAASKYYQRAPNASTIDRMADWLGI